MLSWAVGVVPNIERKNEMKFHTNRKYACSMETVLSCEMRTAIDKSRWMTSKLQWSDKKIDFDFDFKGRRKALVHLIDSHSLLHNNAESAYRFTDFSSQNNWRVTSHAVVVDAAPVVVVADKRFPI